MCEFSLDPARCRGVAWELTRMECGRGSQAAPSRARGHPSQVLFSRTHDSRSAAPRSDVSLAQGEDMTRNESSERAVAELRLHPKADHMRETSDTSESRTIVIRSGSAWQSLAF